MTSQIVEVKISDLRREFFVRTKLDDDHVIALAQLIEAGKNLPPIRITRDMIVVDGRHRIGSHELLERTSIEAEYVSLPTELELIGFAYKCNTGGPLPPTVADNEHVVKLLLSKGAKLAAIAELMGLPTSIIRSFVRDIKAKQKKTAIGRAMALVASGNITADDAASQCDIDLEDLQNALAGRKKKLSPKGELANISKATASRFKAFNLQNGALLTKLIRMVEDGEIALDDALEVVSGVEKHLKHSVTRVQEWRSRLSSQN